MKGGKMRILPISTGYRQNVNSSTGLNRNYTPIFTQGCDRVIFSGKNISARKVIILLGAPNSGKGTCARKLAEKFGIPQISTGEILRNEVKNLTELGKKAKEFMNSGKLVPDELIMKIFKNRIAQSDCRKGFILDGFPRTINQAKQLDKVLKANKNNQLNIVNLDVDKSILFARSASRYICEDCSKIHSVKNYNMQTSRCDCGGHLMKRSDDTPEILSKRLENYDNQTLPLLKYYGDKVKQVEIKGEDVPASKTLARVISKIEDNK